MNLPFTFLSWKHNKPWSISWLAVLIVIVFQVGCTETKIYTERDFLASASSGDTLVLAQCLKSGIDPDITNDSSLTALMLSARRDHAACIKILLEAGANSHYMNRRDVHPVGLARTRGYQEVVDIIFDHQRNEWQGMQDPFDPDLFLQALKFDEYFIVEAFIKNGFEINVYDHEGLTPIVSSVFYSSNLVLKTLLAHGADPNSSFDTRECLAIASMFGDSTAVSLLLNAGANVDAIEGALATALMFAAEEGALNVVKMLLEAGADITLIDANKDTALKKAKRNGYEDIVALLAVAGQ